MKYTIVTVLTRPLFHTRLICPSCPLLTASGHTGAGHFGHSAPQFPASSVPLILKEAKILARYSIL